MARPAWRRFAAVVRIDHCTGEVTVVGDDARSVDHLATLARKARRDDGSAGVARHPYVTLDAGEADAAHLDRIRQALSLIAAGDLYEINLARRIPLAIHGDALGLFTLLLESAPAPWGFLQDLGQPLVVASSPELALSVDGDRLRTCPIKGTRPRSANASEDERLARELEMDPKERAELTMAIDVHRNDLGRVAVPGTVRVLGPPRVLGGRTVWSRVAEIEAQRAPGISLDAIARAVLPCGSVTGAPKVRAMEVIARLEPWRRGLYTGVFGYVGRGGQLALAMAIRTLQLTRRDGRGSQGGGAGDAADFVGDYFSGGGIVADSIPERELEETRWKAVQLGQLGRACANSVA
jgi:anthranilate/para-aminobenzoate synthase component I